MKQIVRLYTMLCCAAVILAAAACSDIMSPLVFKGTGLQVTVSDGGINPKTLYPSANFTKYILTFEGPGTAVHDPVTLDKNVSYVEITGLAPGLWAITATGYVLINGTEYAAAEGSEKINVNAGQIQRLVITISARNKEGGPMGFFSYSVSYPENKADYAGLSIYPFGQDRQGVTFDLATDPEGTIELDPGYYLLTIQVSNDYQTAGRTEVVHIYSNMETRADYVFHESGFVDLITISGKVNVRADDKTPDSANIYAYFDADKTMYAGMSAVNLTAQSWSMKIPACDIGAWLYFTAEVFLNGIYKIQTIDKVHAVKDDNSGIDLGTFNVIFNNNNNNNNTYYTVTFNINGGAGATPAAQTVPAGFGITLPGGSGFSKALHSFDGWNTKSDGAGTHSAAGSSYMPAANITLYARWTFDAGKLDELSDWITEQPGGSNMSAPINLSLELQLTDARWQSILGAIETADKYIALDLSACTRSDDPSNGGLRSDGAFDPISDIATGKDKIVTIALPDTAASIADGNISNPTFRNFNNLTSFSGKNLTSIGDWTFYRCTSLALTGLPAGITSIGNGAFYGCTSLALTELPAGITSISNEAFSGCTSLALTKLPAGITSIGDWTFSDCTSLALTELPAGITSIGYEAFSYCTSLALVICNAITPPELGINVFLDSPILQIKVPAASVDAYKAAPGWDAYADIISAIGP